MSTSCAKCGGSLSNPFDFSGISGDTCQCNTGGLVVESSAVPGGICCVVSVNGQTGVVVLDIDDIDLLGNQFFSETLVWASITAAPPIVFDNLSGLISHAYSGVVPGTYGSSSEIPIITVNITGHVTDINTTPIKINYNYGPNLEALGEVVGEGLAARIGVDTWALRVLTGTAGRIAITNTDGVAGNPIFDLVATAVTPGEYGGVLSWAKITIDAYGRITAAETIAMPAPTIPPHTHELGDLSNVDPTANTATTNDLLYWNGSEWIPGPTNTDMPLDSLTLAADVEAATSSLDIDATDLGQVINTVYRFADINDRYKVSISAILYIARADLPANPATSPIYGFQIGTVPAGHEPIHPVILSVPGTFQPTDIGLDNFDGSVSFAGTQVTASMSITINPDGEILLNVTGNSAFSAPTLSAVDQLIIPITVEYLTKLIVP